MARTGPTGPLRRFPISRAKRTFRPSPRTSEFDPGCVKTHKFEMRRVFTQPRPKADVSRTFSGCYGLRCLRDFQQVHMRRIHLDCCCAATWPLAVEAQQTNSQRRIAILMILAKDDPEADARITAFKQGLNQAGWIEGRNIQIQSRWSAGNETKATFADTRLFQTRLALGSSKAWRGPAAMQPASSLSSMGSVRSDWKYSRRLRRLLPAQRFFGTRAWRPARVCLRPFNPLLRR